MKKKNERVKENEESFTRIGLFVWLCVVGKKLQSTKTAGKKQQKSDKKERRKIEDSDNMAEYEGNGDFNYSGDGSSDFKRRDNNATTSVKSDDETEENVQLPEKVNEYIRELLNEKMSMDHKYPHAEKLLEAG